MSNFLEMFDVFTDCYRKENDLYGYLRLTYKDEIIYEKFMGYGDYDKKTCINKNSIFNLYSLSKPFCAIGLLKLYDKGLIDIDKHPGEYLPHARGFDGSLTIRNLLNHESGLPDFLLMKDFREKNISGTPQKMRENIELLTEYPMNFKPGEDFEYANVNFNIAALICENISGMPYAEYMRKEVFEPFGMKSAFVDDGTNKTESQVSGHTKTENKIVCVKSAKEYMLGAGDIAASADDVYCLNKAIKNRLVLKEKTWEMALMPSPVSNWFGFGCGVGKWNDKKKIVHNGGSAGFRTMHLQLHEDDLDMILLSNCDWTDGRNIIAEELCKAFYEEKSSSASYDELDKGYI